MFSFKLNGLEKTLRGLDRIDRNVALAVTHGMQSAGTRIAATVQRHTPERSGETRAKWYLVPPVSVAPGVIVSKVDHPWNEYGAVHADTRRVVNDGRHNLLATLERGSAPHVIRARNADMLAFIGSWTGGMIFRKSVNHPGTPAFGMVAKTVAVEQKRTPATVRGRVETVLRREAGRGSDSGGGDS